MSIEEPVRIKNNQSDKKLGFNCCIHNEEKEEKGNQKSIEDSHRYDIKKIVKIEL